MVNGLCGRSVERAEIPPRLDVGDKHFSEPQMVVDALNEHFASIGIKTAAVLGEPMHVGSAVGDLRSSDGCSFSLRPLASREMCEAVRVAKPDLGDSLENVPSHLFADFLVLLADPLTAVFNSSVRNGVFPETLKVVSVVPLYKGKGS